MTSENSSKSTCSAALLDGRSRSDSLDGPTTDLFGQVLAHASRSRSQDNGSEKPILVTSGLSGIGSSASAVLQESLGSRLRERFDTDGSTLFSLTWRKKLTPAGRPYCQLAASARRISDSGCGSWPTPAAQEAGGTPEQFLARKEKAIANGAELGVSLTSLSLMAQTIRVIANGSQSAAIQTDATGDDASSEVAPRWAGSGQTMTAGWPTPMAGTPAQKGYNEAGNNDSSRKTVALASWPTPQSRDGAHSRSGQPERTGGRRRNLGDYVTLANWATPTSRDMRSEIGSLEMMQRRQDRPQGKPLSKQVLGATLNGSNAQTEKRGQLNPRFSLWLMGYPEAWDQCAPTSSPKSRKRS